MAVKEAAVEVLNEEDTHGLLPPLVTSVASPVEIDGRNGLVGGKYQSEAVSKYASVYRSLCGQRSSRATFRS